MSTEPLASRIHPRDIDEIISQQHLTGLGDIIRKMVDTKKLTSTIFCGSSDIGRTGIAKAISGSTQYKFGQLNAVASTKKDMQLVVGEAKMSGQVILLLDEIRRLDKARQDFLLPHLENGKIVLIGATTSSPYHAINPATRSRAQIFELYPLNDEDVRQTLTRTVKDDGNGLKTYRPKIDEDVMTYFSTQSRGDIRSTLGILELAILNADNDRDGYRHVTLRDAKNYLQEGTFISDKDSDMHYDVMSTFQKSIHSSDINTALHYLARLIEAGDLPTIVRRLLIISHENISLASPNAGQRMLAAIESAECLDLPEAGVPLNQTIIELYLSPKSNSAMSAIDSALSDIRNGHVGQIPNHLKDGHYQGAKGLGRSIGYKYPCQYVNGYVSQQYLSDELKNKIYYGSETTPKSEQQLREIYNNLLKQRP